MLTVRELARMLTRLFGALYLVVGISVLAGMVIVVELNFFIPSQDFHIWAPTFITYLAFYGAVSFFGGLGLLLLSNAIVRFASKSER
jgi:hypothetical protein